MVSMPVLTGLVSAFVASLLLVALVLRFSVRLGLVSAPNERSSHSDERPTGGGLAIVVPVLVCLIWLSLAGSSVNTSLVVGCGGLALIGYLDDVRELSARLRFGLQALAVGIVLFGLGLGYPLWLLGCVG